MKIKPKIYESLTINQRIITAIEAITRGDKDEADFLLKTCPKEELANYKRNYNNYINRIRLISLSIENYIQSNILDYLFFLRSGLRKDFNISLQNISDIKCAGYQLFKDMGLSETTIEKLSPAHHFTIETLLNIAPEPDLNRVKTIRKAILQDFKYF